jgi:8-oxo-dGTP pyrophosphatase MutT (NUDIX family)
VQTGALPWRLGRKKEAEVLLVTGRRSGRWMIPKGWPIPGKSLAGAAAQEAYEEAGVEGRVDKKPLGSFRHTKQHLTLGMIDVSILVHPLAVEREHKNWPEHGQRERKWLSIARAADSVDSDDLKQIILDLQARVSAK